MKFLEHIKLAGFIGLATGVFHGTVDVIARLSVWSFEWFELYQTLLLSSISFIFILVFLSIIIGLLSKIINIKKSKSFFFRFYLTTALALLVGFYSVMYVNSSLLLDMSFFSHTSIITNFTIVFIIGILYILFLTNWKNVLSPLIQFLSKNSYECLIYKHNDCLAARKV